MPKRLELGDPYLNFIARFWVVLREDAEGRGCPIDDDADLRRSLSYSERVKIEREKLRREAHDFIRSQEFVIWAMFSGLNPYTLRERMEERC